MRGAVLTLLLAVVTAVACTDGAGPVTGAEPDGIGATDGVVVSEPVPRQLVAGGTVRVRAPAEPTSLNPVAALEDDAAGLITHPVLAPLWRTGPDGAAEPWLLAAEPDVTVDEDGTPTVVYEVRDDAVWSDGQPIDGRDVLFTLEACQALVPRERGGQPCSAVDTAASRADGRRATVVFTRPVGTWRTLLADLPVLPEHLLRGRDVRDVWSRTLPVSSGPFQFTSWTPGERIVLVRNDDWWGERPPLDRIEVLFDGTEGITDLLDGAVDVAAVDATVANLERARATPQLRVAVGTGTAVEALDFNVASPRVGRAAVRRAVVAALDTRVLVDEVVRPIVPTTRPWPQLLVDGATASPAPSAAPDAGPGDLDRAGCGRDADGVAVCDGATMRLRLAVVDDAWRHGLVAEYVASQLADIGVEVVAADDEASWDLRVDTIDAADPLAIGRRWRCDSVANEQAYCNPALDDLLDRAGRLAPGEERDALLAEAELMLGRDRPTFPLYPVPQMLAYRSVVRGPVINSGPWGVTWNAEQWARTASATD